MALAMTDLHVTNLYGAFLQRGPDAGGLSWWSGQLSVGSGRQNVLNAFATCGELIIQNFAGEWVRVDPATMNRVNVWLWSGQIYSSPGSRDLTPMEAANVIDATANARRVIGKQPDVDRPGALKPEEKTRPA